MVFSPAGRVYRPYATHYRGTHAGGNHYCSLCDHCIAIIFAKKEFTAMRVYHRAQSKSQKANDAYVLHSKICGHHWPCHSPLAQRSSNWTSIFIVFIIPFLLFSRGHQQGDTMPTIPASIVMKCSLIYSEWLLTILQPPSSQEKV